MSKTVGRIFLKNFLSIFFYVQTAYGTLKQHPAEFKNTQVTKKLNHLDHIKEDENLWLFSGQIQEIVVPKETLKFL